MSDKFFQYCLVAWILALVSLGVVVTIASDRIEEQKKQVERVPTGRGN